jgi:hypothetical protein
LHGRTADAPDATANLYRDDGVCLRRSVHVGGAKHGFASDSTAVVPDA